MGAMLLIPPYSRMLYGLGIVLRMGGCLKSYQVIPSTTKTMISVRSL